MVPPSPPLHLPYAPLITRPPQSKDSSHTYIHLSQPRFADLFEVPPPSSSHLPSIPLLSLPPLQIPLSNLSANPSQGIQPPPPPPPRTNIRTTAAPTAQPRRRRRRRTGPACGFWNHARDAGGAGGCVEGFGDGGVGWGGGEGEWGKGVA